MNHRWNDKDEWEFVSPDQVVGTLGPHRNVGRTASYMEELSWSQIFLDYVYLDIKPTLHEVRWKTASVVSIS